MKASGWMKLEAQDPAVSPSRDFQVTGDTI